MALPDVQPEDPDLVTVSDFAHKYRVDPSVVRSWVKSGYINYELVGPRKMRKVRVSQIVKPIEPTQEARNEARSEQNRGTGETTPGGQRSDNKGASGGQKKGAK